MREPFYNDLLFIHKIGSYCDYFWPQGNERYEKQWEKFGKPLIDFKDVKPYSIICADIVVLADFFLFEQIEVPFVLLSLEQDFSVPFYNSKTKDSELSTRNLALLENKNLIKWFSINVDLKHPKLEPIPIGLSKHVPTLIHEHNYMGWNVNASNNDVDYFFKNFLNIHQWSIKENMKKLDKKLLYCRMTVKNSKDCFHEFENIREDTLVKLKVNGFDGIDPTLTYWTEYMLELINYKFCLSLPGKGLDCYRTWEALSAGVIPVVISTNLDPLYQDLPVIIVKDASEITKEFLDMKFEEIGSRIEEFKWEKLSTSYWVHKIKSELSLREKENDLEKVIEHVKYSIENANNACSKVNEHILNYSGFSGFKTRHLYNNICSMDHCRYLEIGTWHGSSSISAMYGNKLDGVFIDNYSLFDGNRDIFLKAVEKYKGECKYVLLDEDCWKVDLQKLGRTFNTYLYDGGHTYEDQYNAIKYYYDVLEENCIVMVDDWSWEDVRNGTLDAFHDLGTKIKFRHEIITEQPHYNQYGTENYWNGCGIFVIGK